MMAKTNNIPKYHQFKWYERNGIEFDLQIDLLPGGVGLRNWLFAYDGEYKDKYHGKKCFWLRGWVKVLGIRIGAGVFFSGSSN